MLNAEEPSRQFSEPLKRKRSDCKAAALSPSTLQWNQRPVAAYTGPRNGIPDINLKLLPRRTKKLK